MDKIVEFTPVELITVNDINDLPDEYVKLLCQWLKIKIDYNGDGSDLEDFIIVDDDIVVKHWEWKFHNDYYLVIDISFFSGGSESGVICFANEVVFEIDSVCLRSIDKKSPLYTRMEALDHVRLIDCEEHQHCNYVYELYEELKADLEEEEVSEGEFTSLIKEPYVHYSSDDASDVSGEL